VSIIHAISFPTKITNIFCVAYNIYKIYVPLESMILWSVVHYILYIIQFIIIIFAIYFYINLIYSNYNYTFFQPTGTIGNCTDSGYYSGYYNIIVEQIVYKLCISQN